MGPATSGHKTNETQTVFLFVCDHTATTTISPNFAVDIPNPIVK